jgi:hypothetical protein
MRHLLFCALLVTACGDPAVPTPEATNVPVPAWVEDLHPEARPVVTAGYAGVMACAAEVGGQPTGQLEMMLGIGNGKVKTNAVLSNETGSGALAECVTDRVRKWRFPKGFDGTMQLPFEFGGPT